MHLECYWFSFTYERRERETETDRERMRERERKEEIFYLFSAAMWSYLDNSLCREKKKKILYNSAEIQVVC